MSTATEKRRTIVILLIGVILGTFSCGLVGWIVLYSEAGQRVARNLLASAGDLERPSNSHPVAPQDTTPIDTWTKVLSQASPLWYVRPGYDVRLVAGGFTYPVNIAFKEHPSDDPDAPFFYVNELHGAIKYVTRRGEVKKYAEGLINHEPIPIPKSDEIGINGMTTVPDSEDLIVTGAYVDEVSGLLRNRIMRLFSQPGGRTVKRGRFLLDMVNEYTSPSNFIQQVLMGPDGKLYVSVGDGENAPLAMDMTKFGGKVLRMNWDGTACEDNPFYEPNRPRSPRSYVFAYGLRNVFDFDFDPSSGQFFAADNGKVVDRLIHLVSGGGYAWDGRSDGTLVNALYSWSPTVAPVGLAILRHHTLGPNTRGRLYLGTYGPPAAVGRSEGKQILEFELDYDRSMVKRVPIPLIEYAGNRKSTIVGLAEGPDGLYFTDFFGETEADGGYATGAGSVWKVLPSSETLNLPRVTDSDLVNLTSVERGEVYFAQQCVSCHRIDGNGALVGPDLTGLSKKLDRLHSRSYEARLRQILSSKLTFDVSQRDRVVAVLSATGERRKRVWLGHHLEEPRFDNRFATMPSFRLLPDRQRLDLADYLLNEAAP